MTVISSAIFDNAKKDINSINQKIYPASDLRYLCMSFIIGNTARMIITAHSALSLKPDVLSQIGKKVSVQARGGMMQSKYPRICK